MLNGSHRNRVLDDIDADELSAQLAHERQLAIDHLFAEMPHVEVHVLAVRSLEAAAFLELGGHGAGDDVARAQLHLVGDVSLEETLAVLIEKVAALAAHRLRDQDAREGQASGMELDHLHVLQPDARSICERHTVARADVAIGGECVDASKAACGEDHGLGGDRLEPTAAHVDRHHAYTARILNQELGSEGLVVPVDLLELQGGLEHGVKHVEPGLVGGEAGAPRGHAAKRPHGDLAVGVTAPWAAPVLHLDYLDGRLAHEGLDHVLVGEIVGAFDGVEGMGLVAVLGAEHGRGSAFGRYGVTAHRVDLRDHPYSQSRVGVDHGYRRPDAGQPAADHQDVVALRIHAKEDVIR